MDSVQYTYLHMKILFLLLLFFASMEDILAPSEREDAGDIKC